MVIFTILGCFFNLQIFDFWTVNCLTEKYFIILGWCMISPHHPWKEKVVCLYSISQIFYSHPCPDLVYNLRTLAPFMRKKIVIWTLSGDRWLPKLPRSSRYSAKVQKRLHLPYLGMDGITLWRELSVYYRHVGNAHQRKNSVLCTNVQQKTIQHILWFLSLATAGGLWYRCCILDTAFLVLFRALNETCRSLHLLAPGKCFWTFCGVQLSHTRESCPFKCLDTLFSTISHCKKQVKKPQSSSKTI